MSRDPHFDEILGVLAALGAGPEHVSAVAQAYMRRLGPEPAEPAPISSNNCAETTERVSLGGENMSKHKMPKSLGQTMGYLYRRGKPPNQMWYGRYRRPALMKDGTIRFKTKNDRLGPVSMISEAKAQEELRRRILPDARPARTHCLHNLERILRAQFLAGQGATAEAFRARQHRENLQTHPGSSRRYAACGH